MNEQQAFDKWAHTRLIQGPLEPLRDAMRTSTSLTRQAFSAGWQGCREQAQARITELERERDRLKAFFRAWERCESNRGCYSCCEQHDNRCRSLAQVPQPCSCGRDELDAACLAIDEAQSALEESG